MKPLFGEDRKFPFNLVATALNVAKHDRMNMPCPVPVTFPSRPLAVFDLDDTLNRLTIDVCREMKKYGVNVDYEDIVDFDWHATFGPHAPPLEAFFCQNPLLENAAPNPDGVLAAQQLLAEGWDVEVWTARAWHPDGERITRQWLDRHGLNEVPARLCDTRHCKSSLISDGRVPDLYVDDAAHHVLAMAESGSRMATLISRPWNRGIIVPWRVHCLSELGAMAAMAAEFPEPA